MKDRLFQIWLALRCGAANREFVRLLDQYGSPYEIFSADEEEIAGMPCSDELKQRLLDKSLEECYHIQTFCQTYMWRKCIAPHTLTNRYVAKIC